jgi:uncharacterized protein YdcH (DUF465 family)
MLHEYRDIISKLKVDNAHFAKIFEKHNELDEKVNAADKGESAVTDYDMEVMKKEKLKLKDEAYAMIMEYKKEHNL